MCLGIVPVLRGNAYSGLMLATHSRVSEKVANIASEQVAKFPGILRGNSFLTDFMDC
jgi:hypothetical protein